MSTLFNSPLGFLTGLAAFIVLVVCAGCIDYSGSAFTQPPAILKKTSLSKDENKISFETELSQINVKLQDQQKQNTSTTQLILLKRKKQILEEKLSSKNVLNNQDQKEQIKTELEKVKNEINTIQK